MDGLFLLFLAILAIFFLCLFIAFIILCFKFIRDVPNYLCRIARALENDENDFDEF